MAEQKTPNNNFVRVAVYALVGSLLGIGIMLFGLFLDPQSITGESLAMLFFIIFGFLVFARLILSLMKL
jgi:hypothetical protein